MSTAPSALPSLDAGDIAKIAASGAALTGSILAGFSSLGVLSGSFAMAGPIGAGVAALVGVGVLISGLVAGCGQTCVVASQDADKIESYLNQNNTAYFALPVHYRSFNLAAQNNVKTALAVLQQACSDPALGAAGQRCISERLVQGNPAPWCPNPNHVGCDWITNYLLPLQNDPNVVPDPTPAAVGGSAYMTMSGTIAQPQDASLQYILGALGLLVILKKARKR